MAVAPRRSPRRPWGALLLLAILVAALGWVLYLRLTDQPLRDPFGIYQPPPQGVQPADTRGLDPIPPPGEGMVRALISAREIPAYAKVTRDDLFDQRRGIFAFMDVTKEFADANGVLIGTEGILGRVMTHTKGPGFAFTDADFFPKGTRPGMAAGIPANQRGLRIDVELVRGIIGLNPGDRFDVISTRTIEPAPDADLRAQRDQQREAPAVLGAFAELVPDRSGPAPRPRRRKGTEAVVDVIVQGGTVVSALETRLVPTSSASLTSGQINGTRPVQEMVIALAPDEVAPLTAAMRLEADLTCVARSGRPDDQADSITPGLAPKEDAADDDLDDERVGQAAVAPFGPGGAFEQIGDVTVVETIVGGTRALTAVPKAKELEPDQDDAR